jgi:hypothetical protein
VLIEKVKLLDPAAEMSRKVKIIAVLKLFAPRNNIIKKIIINYLKIVIIYCRTTVSIFAKFGGLP